MVLGLPQGYETLIGESGELLSGGQRQRIALARALYGEPALLLLDEPNASLDTEGEAALDRVMRQLKADGVTIIAVTHRPSLIALADRILRLRDGQVEQFGPPPDLPRAGDDRIAGGMLPAEVNEIADVDITMLRATRSSLKPIQQHVIEPLIGGNQ
jgi:ATP-binding cassette subfamily C exporter for protease/lipase